MKTIYLARHAKSSWDMSFVLNLSSDFDRPLNKRGESDAVKVGDEMKKRLWQPDVIISSPAKRAKQTCLSYCENLDYSSNDIEWDTNFYEAYTVTLLQKLSNIDERFKSVLLMGHNPSMESLLLHLCGSTKAAKYQQDDGKLLTTANVAKLSYKGLWAEIAMGSVSLDALIRPKTI